MRNERPHMFGGGPTHSSTHHFYHHKQHTHESLLGYMMYDVRIHIYNRSPSFITHIHHHRLGAQCRVVRETSPATDPCSDTGWTCRRKLVQLYTIGQIVTVQLFSYTSARAHRNSYTRLVLCYIRDELCDICVGLQPIARIQCGVLPRSIEDHIRKYGTRTAERR